MSVIFGDCVVETALTSFAPRSNAWKTTTVLCDALPLVLAADHESRDVLKEQKRDFALRAQLDEVHRFQGRFGEENAVVRHDSQRHVVQRREAGHHRRSVLLLELQKPASVHDPRDEFSHIEALLRVLRNDPRNLRAIKQRLVDRLLRERDARLQIAVLDDFSADIARFALRIRHVVRHAAQTRVHIRTAQVLR